MTHRIRRLLRKGERKGERSELSDQHRHDNDALADRTQTPRQPHRQSDRAERRHTLEHDHQKRRVFGQIQYENRCDHDTETPDRERQRFQYNMVRQATVEDGDLLLASEKGERRKQDRDRRRQFDPARRRRTSPTDEHKRDDIEQRVLIKLGDVERIEPGRTRRHRLEVGSLDFSEARQTAERFRIVILQNENDEETDHVDHERPDEHQLRLQRQPLDLTRFPQIENDREPDTTYDEQERDHDIHDRTRHIS